MRRHFVWLVVILLITVFAIWVCLPGTTGIHIDTDGDGTPDLNFNVTQSLGLDLVGGLRVLLQAELPAGSFTVQDLQQTANNVSRRVNALGVTEPTVQIQGSDRILVELPGVSDPTAAVNTIQQTALLEFIDMSGMGSQVRSLEGHHLLTTEQLRINQARQAAGATVETFADTSVNPQTGQPYTTVMTGAGLQAASAQFRNQWIISFELTDSGSAVFGPFTNAHIGQPLGIVLDGVLLSAPVINARLDTGGVIQGQFDETSAKQLALQLRSGALPIPLRVESAETVGATLGQESVNLSIRAGIIGVIVIFLFMIIYYRIPGIAAALALLVFIALNYAFIKIIPVTLTLAGIAGFLISIGTAVDGNILIFERIKEEVRHGVDLDSAIDIGFRRAWTTIRDSNISTIIICGVLFLFGLTPGAAIVSGFAVTLALGLFINLFTAVLVTRTFLHLFYAVLRQPVGERTWLFGL
ncbi:MAG: protein translocase subunit SecD [Anaerolineae bacterium]